MQQPSLKQEESSPNVVAKSTPDVEILNVSKQITEKHSTMTAAAIRVRKRLFLQNEASNSEANRQLEWEKNRQKLVNLAASKSAVQQSAVATPTTVIVDNMNKIILDGSGKISVSGTSNKALLTLQGRTLGDVIKEGKVVKKRGLITGVIGIEMEKGLSHISRVQNMDIRDGNIQTGKYSSKNYANASNESKQGKISSPAQSENSKEGCNNMNKVVNAVSTPEVKGNDEQATDTPVSTLSSGQVLKGCLVMGSPTTTNSTTSATSSIMLQNSVQTFKAVSASVEQLSFSGADQREKKIMLTEPVTQKNSEVVCISDDSDNSDVEFVGTVYNPKLDYTCDKQNVADIKHRTPADSASQQKHIAPKSVSYVQGDTSTTRIKAESSPCNGTKRVCSSISTQDNPTSQQMHIAPNTALHVTGETFISTVKPVITVGNCKTQGDTVLQQTHVGPKTNSHIQGEMSTAGMKPITSTFNSAMTLQNNWQTLLAKPHLLTSQFAPITSQLQDNFEQKSPANHVELEMPMSSQKLDNLSELLQKPVIVQPDSSVNVLKNCLLQTESVKYVQSQSVAPSTVGTIVSSFSPSSTKNNQNIHLYNSVAVSGTITHTQKCNSVSNTAVDNLGINLESQLVPSYVPASQAPFHINPYVATAGAIQVKTSGMLSEQTRRPADSFTQVICPGALVAKTNSPVPKPGPFSQIPGTSLTPTRIIAPPLDQARSPNMCYEKIRYPGTPVNLRRNTSHVTQANSHSLPPEVRTSSSSLVKTRYLDSSLTNIRGSDISLDEARVPGTPVAKRIPGTTVMHTRSPAIHVAQTRIPGTPVAKARSPNTPVAKTRSPNTPVAKTRNHSTPAAQMRSPGSIQFTQAASPGASFIQARSSSSPLFQGQIQGVHVSPTGASVSRGRGNRNSGPQRASSEVQQQLDQTAARLVVIPGDENVSKYAIVFPSGAKVILTPKQVADIRAANGGLLITNM